MRKYIKSILQTIIFVSLISIAQAQTPQFSFANGTTGSNSIPFGGGTWADQRNQWFYAPGDFGNTIYSGLITKIYLKHGTTITATTWTNLTISIGQPNITGLTTAWVTGLTKVYSAASHTEPAGIADQWFAFTLQTPFLYNPNLPLVIETIQTGTTGGKSLRAGGTPIDPAYTGYTQTYGASGAASGTTRRYSYALGLDLTSPYYTDAGVSDITKPTGSISVGIDTVKCNIRNYGIKNLTSVGLRWSVDGVLQTSPPNWTGSLKQLATDGPITLGTYNFPVGSHTIKVWTVNPNGVTADSNAMNDASTTTIMVCATLLNGNYTIGAAPSDFLTFGDAVVALTSCGISGPVKFTVKKGTYNERVIIKPVINGSGTNTVTFDGVHPDSVKLTWSGTTSAYSTILFNGADYITIKNMTVENTGSTNANSICLTNSANYNTFDNLKLFVDQGATVSTVNNFVACSAEGTISGYGDCANYTILSNCLIKGGYYGVKFNGTSSSVKCTNNSTINCTFDKQYYYGINYYYQTYPRIIDNYVAGIRNTTSYGIYNYYGGTGGQIIGNTVYALNYGLYQNYCSASRIERNKITSGYYTMYVYQESNTTDSTMIVNNMIRNGSNPSYAYGYGLYLYYGYNVRVYHNTIQADSTYSSPTSYGAMRVYYGSGNKVKNNILRCFGNLPVFNTDGVGIANGDLDYNIYYTDIPGNIIAYWGTTAFTSFSTWKAAYPAHNKNSIYMQPKLVSKYNQHLMPTAPFYRGAPLGVEVDNDNDQRCIPLPTIGADEYNHPFENADVDFHVGSSVCAGSPYTFLNKANANEPKMHFWFLDNTLVSNSINYSHTFGTTGTYKVKLVTRSCSSLDTVEKTVNVLNVSKKPVSNFIINKNLVEVFEPVVFNDMSSNCPESWKWKITPDSIFDSELGKKMQTYTIITGSDTSNYPEVRFLYSGKYTICLTTSNKIGAGTTYCLNNYIEVMPSINLCSGTTQTKESYGSLYDDGGYANFYSPNKNCGVYIHPCASEVSFVFNTFDVAVDDYVRIYDGPSNMGTPLWNTFIFPYGLNNSTIIPEVTDTFVSKSGKLYIEFKSNGSSQSQGFGGIWYSKNETFASPVASFEVNDTVCNGVPVTFKNNSKGSQPEYLWDYQNDGTFDANTNNGSNIYKSDGDYSVKLVINACGGTDTLVKKINVRTSTLPPEFEILASNVHPNAKTENVTIFENTVKNCVDSTIWTISPSSYTLLSGSLTNSYELNIVFDDTVCYDFSVIGIYHGKSDTMVYPCFIKPLIYCKPIVKSINADVGISRVKINTIDNYSDIGLKTYTDYFNDFSTDLERGSLAEITLSRTTSFNPINRKVWIDYNKDGSFDDVNELVAQEASSYNLNWASAFRLPGNLTAGITRLRVGTSLANSSNQPCGVNILGEFEDYKVNIIPDITIPEIILIGGQEIHVPQCTPFFIDPGVIVTDNVDSTLSDSIEISGFVDTKIPGTYVLTYNVHDSEKNFAQPVERKVIVDYETDPPQLSLLGKVVDTMQVFNSYIEQGFTANDTCSGLDTVIIMNEVDTAMLGTFKVTYTAYDLQGNTTVLTRNIVIIDTVPPVLTSISNDTLLLRVYNLLAKPLYSVTDNYYKNMDIVLKGDFYQYFPNGEAKALGFYTLTYVAYDGSGNSASLDFVIHVVDNEKPILQLEGNPMMSICRFDTLIDPGYTVTDNYDPNPVVTLSGTYMDDYYVNRGNGYFELIYTAIDQSGNKAIQSRFIFVTDQGPCASGIENEFGKSGIQLYPNPGNGYFNLAFNLTDNSPVNITVYNMLGEVVYKEVSEVDAKLVKTYDLNYLNQGVYFIRIEQNNQVYSWKYNLVK